jgi:cardiolipin synthase
MRHLPNLLTILRLSLVPCFLAASMQRMYVAAFVIFVSAAMTDILDGMIARRWNLRSRLGAILDPVADKTLMVCGFIYYTFAARLTVIGIPGWLTFAVFIRDALIAIFAYLMYTRIRITRFPPSPAGKLSTLLQAVTLAAVIGANGFAPRLAALAEVLFRVSLVVTLYAGWGYMRWGAGLLHEPSGAPA